MFYRASNNVMQGESLLVTYMYRHHQRSNIPRALLTCQGLHAGCPCPNGTCPNTERDPKYARSRETLSMCALYLCQGCHWYDMRSLCSSVAHKMESLGGNVYLQAFAMQAATDLMLEPAVCWIDCGSCTYDSTWFGLLHMLTALRLVHNNPMKSHTLLVSHATCLQIAPIERRNQYLTGWCYSTYSYGQSMRCP